jgi:hypothetical protein
LASARLCIIRIYHLPKANEVDDPRMGGQWQKMPR